MREKFFLESVGIALILTTLMSSGILGAFAHFPNADTDIKTSRAEYNTSVTSTVQGMPNGLNTWYAYGTFTSSRDRGTAQTASPMYYWWYKNAILYKEGSTTTGYATEFRYFTGEGITGMMCRTKQKFQYGGYSWWLEAFAQIYVSIS